MRFKFPNRRYYLDVSMGDFNDTFKRAQSWAASALRRLDDPNDANFRDVFKTIFKTSVTDIQPMPRSPGFRRYPSVGLSGSGQLRPLPVLDHVRRELYSLAYDWTRTDKVAESEVRVHWDGLQRFLRKRPRCYYDPVNDMVRHSGMAEYHWRNRKCLAFVSLEHHGDQMDQHPQRNVIDFTDKALNHQISWRTIAGAQLDQSCVDMIRPRVLEATLIHEMMHCAAYGLVDFTDDNGNTGGWNLIRGLTNKESYICAESIAMLCFAAALADLQPVGMHKDFRYTISKDGKIETYRL